MKDELTRIKAGLLAGVMCLSLSGCASSNGFEFVEGENRSVVTEDNSKVNNAFINKIYVAEVYNKLTNENQLYLVSEQTVDDYKVYNDIFTPYSVIFTNDNERNNFFEFKNVIRLTDYVNALGLTQYVYTYEDLVRILEEIKAVYEFDANLELTK